MTDVEFVTGLLKQSARTHHGTAYLCLNDIAGCIRERDGQVFDPTGTLAKRKAIAAIRCPAASPGCP